jgi:hypothetical protein
MKLIYLKSVGGGILNFDFQLDSDLLFDLRCVLVSVTADAIFDKNGDTGS